MNLSGLSTSFSKFSIALLSLISAYCLPANAWNWGTTNRVWSTPSGGSGNHSSPAIGTNGVIYVGADDGNVYAFNPNGTTQHVWGNFGWIDWSSPAIDTNGIIYIGNWVNNMVGLNPNGATQHIWSTDIIDMSPAIGGDGKIYIGDFGSKFYCFNPDGSTNSVWNLADQLFHCASPAIDTNGYVYVGSYTNLYKFKSSDTNYSISYNHIYDTAPAIGSDGTIYATYKTNLYAMSTNLTVIRTWTHNDVHSDSYLSHPAIGVDGTIYVGAGGDTFYAFNTNGTTNHVWHSLNGFAWDVCSAPAIGSDGTIYVGMGDSNFYAFNSDGTTNSIWSVPSMVYAAPTIGTNGIVYVMCGNTLYGFNGTGGGLATNAPWPKFHQNLRNTGRAEGSTGGGGGDTSTNYYVSPSGSDDNNGTSWALAKRTIQAAVNIASNGNTILVTNGTYVLTNQIALLNGITVQSVNGAQSTIVNGNGVTRCFLVSHTNVIVDGFTVSNGYATGGFITGAGILNQGGTVRNCIIVNNRAVAGDYLESGGGVCIVSNGTIEKCIISRNFAQNEGGGVYMPDGGTAKNCLIAGNTANQQGGGVEIYSGTIENCTIARNQANEQNGGGIYISNGKVRNSIIYFNNAPANANWHSTAGTFSNCCSTPSLAGSGNIVSDPLFTDSGSGYGTNCTLGNYQPVSNSPCINTGTNQTWMTGNTDLAGNTRIINHIVDMGAYEYNSGEAPDAPTGVTASDGTFTNMVKVSWNASAGTGLDYYIWRSTQNNIETADLRGFTLSTNYYDTRVVSGITYYYWVRAHTVDGTDIYSPFSEPDTGYAGAGTPGQVAFSAVSYTVNESAGNVTLTITRNSGSDGAASVNYSTQNGTATAGVDYTSVSGTLSWSDGESSSKTITVAVINRSGKQDNRAFTVNLSGASGVTLASPSSASVTIVDRSPISPTGVTASDGSYTDKILIYWTSVSSATSYKVWRSTDNNSQHASVLGTSTTSFYLDTTATAGAVYYYWIQAVNEAGTSGLSTPNSGYCGSIASDLASPTGVNASDGSYTDRIRITWQAVNNATRYEVWRNTENNCSAASLISDPTGTSYDDYSISQGIYYYYWIRARNANRYSNYSSQDAGWRRLSPPSGISASDGIYPYHIRVVWNAVANAAWYEVWREEVPGSNSDGGNLAKVAQTGEVYFNDYYTKSGVYYRYKVKACNGLCSSDFNHDTGVRQVNTASTSLPVLNDYDGDRLSDLALFNPLSGVLDVLCSALGRQTFTIGAEHSQEATGDLDGDGKADPLVYCPDTAIWRAMFSNIGYYPIVQAYFGERGNAVASADYDGDGLADLATYNEADGILSVMLSNGGTYDRNASCSLGGPGYLPVSADYDGDGQADPAVYSESEGRVTVMFSRNEYFSVSMAFGGPGISIYASDFDGDGKADPVLYERAAPSTDSTSPSTRSESRAESRDSPQAGWFDDAHHRSGQAGTWTVLLSNAGYSEAKISFGGLGYTPAIGDYDGDGLADPAIYRESDGQWLIMLSTSGYSVIAEAFGGASLRPIGR